MIHVEELLLGQWFRERTNSEPLRTNDIIYESVLLSWKTLASGIYISRFPYVPKLKKGNG